MMKDSSCSESGVSEIVGALMLISVVVVVVAIMGVYLFSQPSPQKIPSLQASVWNDTQTLSIRHDGGDPLSYVETKIYVNCVDQTSKFNLSTAPTQPWTTWENGDVLQYPTHSFPLGTVMIVYKGASSEVALTTFFVGDVGSACESGVFVPPLPVTAGFTVNSTSGTAPLAVKFTDASTGPVTSWSWTFGDGGISLAQNPLYTYINSGTYSVSLTVSNGTGSSTITRTSYITVNVPAPVAAFTGTPLSGTTPLPVTFTDTSTNIPTGWKWSFKNITPGNNTVVEFSTLQNPVMTFGTGNYSIVLNASNSQGFNMSSQVTFINVSRIFGPGSYYRNISVTNSPAIANYQMVVTVPYDAHMKTDFGDIRFTGTDGTTLYDYWMEKKTDGSSAVFWVNVPTASTTLFRMYYGNSSLTTTSDGTKAFDFFDDFSGDLSKWTVEKTSGVYPRIESGYLVAGGGITSDPYGHTSLGSSPTYNVFQDGIVEFKHQHATDGIGEVAFRGNFALNRGYKGRWDARTGNEQIFLMPPYSGWANIGTAIPKWVTVGPWHDGKMIVHGNIMDLYDDGTFKGTWTDNTYTLAGEIALQNHYGSYTNFDDVRVRKYAAPEPTTSIGPEITV